MTGRVNIGAVLFLLMILSVVGLAAYREAGPCDPTDDAFTRFLRKRIAGCSSHLVRPGPAAEHWHLDASQWETKTWEDARAKLVPDMRLRVCYRRGETEQVYVDAGNCSPPKVDEDCQYLARKKCIIVTKALGATAMNVYVPGDPVEAEGTWEVIDPGHAPPAGKRKKSP